VPRRLLAIPLALSLLAAAPAQARTVDVPAVLHKQIVKARTRSGVPVLLPATISAELRVYPGGTSSKGHYDLNLGYAKDCFEATACFFAAFLGDRGATKASGDSPVTLAGGRKGWFTDIHCGGSCAAPQVEWRQGGVLYTLQAKLATSRTRKRLVALGDAAIWGGAR
jgi:hypothetical protein